MTVPPSKIEPKAARKQALNPDDLFFGDLDLVYGKHLSDSDATTIERNLRIAALFYRRLLVYDGFFHCFGPIWDLWTQESQSKERKKLRRTITKLLESGILVPITRSDGSLLENWMNAEGYIQPGEMLCLPINDENCRYLEAISKMCQSTTIRLPDFGPKEFRSNIFKYLLRDGSPFDNAISELNRVELTKTWETIRDYCYNADQCKFRRGEVEAAAAKACGVDPKSSSKYTEINSKSWQSSQTTFDVTSEYLAFSYLSHASTVYQIILSQLLAAEGGVFSFHPAWMCDEGLYGETYLLGSWLDEDYQSFEEKTVFGRGFTIDDVIAFRELDTGDGRSALDKFIELKRRVAEKPDSATVNQMKEFLIQDFLAQFVTSCVGRRSKGAEREFDEFSKAYEWLSVRRQQTGLSIWIGKNSLCPSSVFWEGLRAPVRQ